MKILHIHEHDLGGGSETVFNLTRNNKLNEINYSGFVKNSNGNNSDIDFISYESYPFFIKSFIYLFSIKNFFALLRFLNNNPVDIIHVHGFLGTLSPSILLAIWLKKSGAKIKVIQTLHDFHLVCPNSVLYNFNKEIICEKCLGKRIKLYPVFFPCERRGYFYSVLKAIRSFISNNLFMHKKVVDKFIVPSNLMLNKLLEEGIHKSKIYLLRNPVIVKENTIVKKANIIAYFGRISKEKDVKFILEAFNYWKSKSKNDFKLYIIGDGEEKENLKNYVVKLSFANDIKIFDFLIDKDLFVKLEQVKYLIMASKLYENAPMTLLEAVSLNIIPIVPDLGGMKETVQDVLKFGRVYEKENIDSLIENIESLELNYNNELEILSKRKIFIFENYGVEKYHEKLKELYSIINNSTI